MRSHYQIAAIIVTAIVVIGVIYHFRSMYKQTMPSSVNMWISRNVPEIIQETADYPSVEVNYKMVVPDHRSYAISLLEERAFVPISLDEAILLSGEASLQDADGYWYLIRAISSPKSRVEPIFYQKNGDLVFWSSPIGKNDLHTLQRTPMVIVSTEELKNVRVILRTHGSK